MSSQTAPTSRTPLLAANASAQKNHASRARPSRSQPSQILRPEISAHNASFLQPRHRRKKSPRPHYLSLIISVIILLCIALVAWDISSYGNCYFQSLCSAFGQGEQLDQIWWENSGAYAPWRSLGAGGGKKGLPRGCQINQVTVLHRHAARYPTTAAGEDMQAVLDKLAHRAVSTPKRHTELAFLTKADLNMTGWKFDNLLNQGRKAAWRSGREIRAVYQNLVDNGEGVFSRASGSDRVVETSGYWLEGFKEQPFKIKSTADLPLPNVVIPEGESSNNTLSVHNCPGFNAQPAKDLSGILDLLKPARDRLNNVLIPRPALTLMDMITLSDLCPYDSQISGSDWEAWSKWCGIFSREEWGIIGHWKDASRYYEAGEGSRYGATMGAGWVNELIARLTDSEVLDNTSTNRTLNLDEQTFPRGGERFFIDFGHDNEMIEVLAAMGVLKQQRPLPTDSLPDKRTFLTSEIIPFGSRIVFERIGCQLGDWEPDPEAPEGEKGDGKKNYLRILINDMITPIEHISCQQSGFVEHKMCEVESFVETQSWSTEEVDWEICYHKS